MIYQPDTLRVYDYSLAADIMMNYVCRSIRYNQDSEVTELYDEG